jgi:hypothetical protein
VESQYQIEGYKQIIKVLDLLIWIEENSYYSSKRVPQGVYKTIRRKQNYKGHERH